MKNTKNIFSSILLVCATVVLTMTGCFKEDAMIVPEQKALFLGSTATGNYSIASPTSTFKIPIGITTPSSTPTTINISVTSTTGAQLGTHYNLSATSITIPAGKVIDTLVVTGVYNQYLAGRKDVLIFKITDESTSPNLRNTFTLNISGPCFEGDVDLTKLLGEYKNTHEDFGGAYGPYTTRITAVNATSATTGTITVANIFDAGWNPITYTLNWTDPNNRTVTIAQQAGIGDAGTVNPAYAGLDVSVRPFAGQVGTFSICNQTLVLRMQVGVTGLGWFGSLYTVNMAR